MALVQAATLPLGISYRVKLQTQGYAILGSNPSPASCWLGSPGPSSWHYWRYCMIKGNVCMNIACAKMLAQLVITVGIIAMVII